MLLGIVPVPTRCANVARVDVDVSWYCLRPSAFRSLLCVAPLTSKANSADGCLLGVPKACNFPHPEPVRRGAQAVEEKIESAKEGVELLTARRVHDGQPCLHRAAQLPLAATLHVVSDVEVIDTPIFHTRVHQWETTLCPWLELAHAVVHQRVRVYVWIFHHRCKHPMFVGVVLVVDMLQRAKDGPTFCVQDEVPPTCAVG